MRCCDASGYRDVFSEARARADARRYRRSGLDGTARGMVEYLSERGLAGHQVLEIGGGVGAVGIELLRAGASRAANVEISPLYEEIARELLQEKGLEDRVERRIGDIVVLDDVGDADTVVLHKVVCCYPNGRALMRAAARRARRYLGVSFSRDSFLVRAFIAIENVYWAVRRSSFRAYVHPADVVIGTAVEEGMRVVQDRGGIIWRSLVLERAASGVSSGR